MVALTRVAFVGAIMLIVCAPEDVVHDQPATGGVRVPEA
jgi:hypothetical protein